jgi:hypothetical protein
MEQIKYTTALPLEFALRSTPTRGQPSRGDKNGHRRRGDD